MATEIHKTAIIGKNVSIGENVYIGPHCLVMGHTEIGDNSHLIGFSSIGSNAEHILFFDKEGTVKVGSGAIIREFVTINAGTTEQTIIGQDCIFLRGSHVGHDSVLEDAVTLSCNATLGGHSHVMTGANLGLGALVHQRAIIGAYSMLGMGAVVTKKSRIEPGKTYAGNPARLIGENKAGLERNGIRFEELEAYNDRYKKLIYGT